MSEATSWSDTHRVQRMAGRTQPQSWPQGVGARWPVKGECDVRLARRLPGKPAEGVSLSAPRADHLHRPGVFPLVTYRSGAVLVWRFKQSLSGAGGQCVGFSQLGFMMKKAGQSGE